MRYLLIMLLCLSAHAEALRLRCVTPKVPSAADLAQNISDVTSHGVGTCVAIGKHELLTVAHVVNGGVVTVEIDGKWRDAEVIKIDIALDLALLKTEATLRKYHEIADGGWTAYVSDHGDEITKRAVAPKIVIVSYDAANGNSGAPVFDDNGKVVALVSGREDVEKPTYATCVPANVIRKFLKGE